MADPTKYVPQYDYSDWQTSNPTQPLPGHELDTDLADIAASSNTIVEAIKDVRRSDGALKNGVVTPDSLSAATKALFGLTDDVAVVTTNIDDIVTVAASIGNVNTVAADSADINVLAPISSSINALGPIASDVTTCASNIAAIQAAPTAASNAAASAASAAASLDSFDDRYLGVKTSDPTLDNDGQALLTGALYWNSVSSLMRVYSGTSWSNVAGVSPIVTQHNGGSNTITLPVDPGSENNVRLYVGGVYQQHDTFSVSGTTLTSIGTFPSGTNNIETVIGDVFSISVPGDGTVTGAKLAAGGISQTQLAAAIVGLSGTYTPTLFNTTNVAASTPYACQWLRVGNIVMVSGLVDIDPTAASVSTVLGLSLPVASNFSNSLQLGGTAVASGAQGQAYAIISDATNDRASITGIPSSAANATHSFMFMYQVI